MFCAKCGEKISDGVSYCPTCGEKVVKTEPTIDKKDTTSKRKIPKLIILLLIVFAVILSGVKAVTYIINTPSEKDIMLAANNLTNEGFVAGDGKWLYYYDDETDELYKCRLSDGKKKELIMSDVFIDEMFFLGNKLYVSTISCYYMIDPNSNETEEIPNTTFTEGKFQTDGNMCYFDCFGSDVADGNLVSQKSNGTKAKTISSIESSRIMFDGDSLYVFSNYGLVNGEENQHEGITKMDSDGTSQELIMDSCPKYFVFGDEKIFYIQDNYIYSMNYDGSNKQMFGEIKADAGLNAYDGYVYFVDYNSGNICKVEETGNYVSSVLNDCKCENINIVGEWIFYINLDDSSNVYKMKLDGTENQIAYQ